MRLIACHSCRAQYDVSGIVAESIRCRCGESIANRDLTAVDAQVHRCGACGAQVAADATSCGYCASEIVREGDLSLICPECFARNDEASRFCTACGVGFNPEPLQVDGHELPCPACEALMPPRQVAGIGLNECPQCNGLWVPGDNFDLLVRRATEARRDAGADAPRTTGGNPLRSAMTYRKCPECMSFMQRRNYKRSSGVILDVCHQHGTWLDADELEQIAGFILSGGKTSAMLDAEHEQARTQAAAAARAAQIQAMHHSRRSVLDAHDVVELTDIGGGLVRLLTRLLT
ncbi:MAG: zf-TFIIB domain-containing protein [Myxococcota bacterium]